MNVRIQTGDTERIEALMLDGSLSPLTGLGNVLLSIRRVSDGYWLDFDDDTFKASGWTTRQQAMTQTDVTNDPGVYHYDLDTSTITNPTADDTYEARVDCASAANVPLTGEIKVGQFVDDIDVAISSRSSHSAGDVDTQLSGTHGSGSWEGSPASVVWSYVISGKTAADHLLLARSRATFQVQLARDPAVMVDLSVDPIFRVELVEV